MDDKSPKNGGEVSDINLKGTTYRVYRHIVKQVRPVGISEIQKALGLSSPSVSQYHIRKLLRLGLIREEQDGFIIDKMVLQNVIRIRRISVPTQTAYTAFFSVTLFILLAFLKPATISSLYFFAIIVNVMALGISLYEAWKTLRHL